jgi:diaminohydroxyphosphoribosylaminopyrimidine deaminase / 5-amino-6-(5-phosphoribosylamino)uracil reductase
VLAEVARELNAPYLKLQAQKQPWVIAKWAMSLDGKMATRTGDSQWISCAASRQIVHQMRGRVDAVVVGRQTALQDDPLLTARPRGPREAARIVLDSQAALPLTSKLVGTAHQTPVIVAAAEAAPPQQIEMLRDAGCEVIVCQGATRVERLTWLLNDLGGRRMTNILVEGGGQVLGSFLDAGLIDEIHVFIAPRLIGGSEACAPMSGIGHELVRQGTLLATPQVERIDSDLYVHGRLRK